MKKEQLIEFVSQSIIAGEIPQEKMKFVHPERLQYFISSAFNTIYYNTYRKDPTELDFHSHTYEADILYDVNEDTYYTTPPKTIVQFPNMGGIRKIGTLQGKKVEFVKSDINESDLVSGTILDLISDSIGYYYANNKIIYRNFDPYSGISKVRLKIVVPFIDLDWEEEVYIPSGKDLDLVQIVKQLVLTRQPEDKQNDNN